MVKRRSRALAMLPLCLDGMQTVIRFLCNAAPPPECKSTHASAHFINQLLDV